MSAAADLPGEPGLATSLIHHPYQPPAGFVAAQPGIHRASTVVFPDVAALRARDWRSKAGYTYGLHGTPTTFTLEERIATLEGGRHTLLVPSGLASISLVDFALLKAGDEVLIPDNAYGPNRELARHELRGWGITHRLYDPLDPASLEQAIGPATALVWLEAAGSVTMEFPDLRALVRIARARGVPTALDNTWGAGIAFKAFDLDPGGSASGAAPLAVDISVQALTKYASGGGDVLMGSVTTADAALHQRLVATHMRMGWGVGAGDVELVLRSMPSMALRYAAQDASARALAAWCASRPEIATVLHPAFSGAPGHAHWRTHCSAAAGLFSVMFDERYSGAQVDAFVDALRRFAIGFSWAGPMSLAVPYELPTLRSRPAWRGGLVRFSVGLEEVADLIADLEQAIGVLSVA